MDDEWVPETLSAALALGGDDDGGAEKVSVATAIDHLVKTRGMSTRRATTIALLGKCDQCNCLIGSADRTDDCECPCHCDCCCPPTFHHLHGCECNCECHYDATSDDDEEDSDAESESTSADSEKQPPVPDDQQEPNEANADDDMTGTPAIPDDLNAFSINQLSEVLAAQLDKADDQAEQNARKVVMELVKRHHVTAVQGKMHEKTPNKHLPTLSSRELELLLEYVAVLRRAQRYHGARLNGTIRDTVSAAVKSTWTLVRMLEQRLEGARAPREPPTNAWSKPVNQGPSSVATRRETFRFDPTCYSPEEIVRYRAVCEQEHAFATATRKPSDDEWTIILGLISGNIIATALPQFLKRCCALTQLVWIYEQIAARAEGELWVQLPRQSKMHAEGQTTRRLVVELRQYAAYQKWSDMRLEQMLSIIKTVAYNSELHSLHFYFYTKSDAQLYDGMKIPFRASTLTLVNPETKLHRSDNSQGVPTDQEDGLVNDRYQVLHRIRLLNVPRHVKMQVLMAFLQSITKNGLKSGVPLDTYGQFADGSIMWDIFCMTAKCPEILTNVHRINLNGHLIGVQHHAEAGPPPCYQCARPGHQLKNCTTPKEDWNSTTLMISAEDIAKHTPAPRAWTTMEEMQAVFDSMAPRSPVDVENQPTQAPDPAVSPGSNPNVGEQTKPSGQVTSPGEPDDDTQKRAEHPPHNSPNDDSGFRTAQQPRRRRRNRRGPSKPINDHLEENTPAQTPAPAKTGTNRFEGLGDSDDESDDEDQHEKNASSGGNASGRTDDAHMSDESSSESESESEHESDIENPPRQGNSPIIDLSADPDSSQTAHSDPSEPSLTQAQIEEDLLRRATQQAHMERVRAALGRRVAAVVSATDMDAIRQAVARAKPNVTTTASVDWILAAIGGRATATLSTGNCQYYAMIESLCQLDMKLVDDPEELVHQVALLKFGLLLAHESTSATDRANNNFVAIVDMPAGTPAAISAEEQQRLTTHFYRSVARSASTTSSTLPEELWGRLDTMRMATKLLNQPIFLIAKSKEPTNCFLNVIQMQKTKNGEEIVGLTQPGVAGWLDSFEAACANTTRPPIVLIHTGNHYNCVIFDRSKPANVLPAKKLKTGVLKDLWANSAVKQAQAQLNNAATKRRQDSVRRAVIDSDTKITEADIVDFLGDDDWSLDGKMELIEILLSGSKDYRALLTFSPLTGADQPMNSSQGSDGAHNTQTSVYTPSSAGSTASSSPMTDASQINGTNSIESQPFRVASQESEDYHQWAAEMWERVSTEWMEQFNERLPKLSDTAGLVRMIKHSPDALIQAGRLCDNPMTLLEHLPAVNVKAWMESRWIDMCTTDLGSIIENVMDAVARPALDNWLRDLKAEPNVKKKRSAMRSDIMWKHMLTHAPEAFVGPSANPLLTRNYKETSANVLVVGELFPTLARHLIEQLQWEGDLSSVTIVTAYIHVPSLRMAFTQATKEKSWDPVAAFIRQQRGPVAQEIPFPASLSPWTHSFFEPSRKRPSPAIPNFPSDSVFGALTQNVRGFKTSSKSQEGWMTGWKRQVDKKKILYIVIQETHVTTTEEAARIEDRWCRVWGRRPESSRPLTFCTITSTKAAGVAILLHPVLLHAGFQELSGTQLHGRCLVVESPSWRFIAVYAPNKAADRERFFAELSVSLPSTPHRTLMLGDFNCVLHASDDRVRNGTWGPERGESPALSQLVHDHRLIDTTVHTASSRPRLHRITYWQGTSGARLDRIYISAADVDWIVEVENIVPVQETDHCGVVVWLRDPAVKPIRSTLPPLSYPVVGRDQEAIERQVGAAVCEVLNNARALGLDIDATIRCLKSSLASVRRAERRRAARQRRKREKRERAQIQTLGDLIRYVQSKLERSSQRKYQDNILQRSGESAHLFKRLVQIDQRRLVPQLTRTCSAPDHDISEANVMATEWLQLLGRRHATVDRRHLRELCQELFVIPHERRLPAAACNELLKAITVDDVLSALADLGRHKAAGPDRLNNDFFKDWAELVAPWLADAFTKILAGEKPPASFAEALVVAIPKAGDPTIATNYRPISLLQSSYKIFTKILASRVQSSLGSIINGDQNGFVRGRALADNVHLMRAVLTTAQACPAPSGAVVLIDFRKAYDSVDRDFLWYALEMFGYPEAFIRLVQQLHCNTTAQFLVNGAVSDKIEVVTGIRQGCPLAPLLFLLAAETLRYAILNEPAIRGMELPGLLKSHTHTFSAFVDDSAVFLRDTHMITDLEAVLDRFGALSGLHAQPHKSHAIVFSPQFTERLIGSFPVVPRGTTVTYLGTEIGLADLVECNWGARLHKIEKRLGMLSQYATSVTDRINIINLACVPSLMFTAQFYPPPAAKQTEIDALWRQFVWKGTTHQEPQRAHKIARTIMELPRDAGGLGLRDYRGATLTQAAMTLLRWNSRPQDKYWDAVRINMQPPAIGAALSAFPQVPVRLPAQPRLTSSVFADASKLVNAAIATATIPPTALSIERSHLIQQWSEPWKGLQWKTSQVGWFRIPSALQQPLRQLQMNTYAAMPPEIRSFWTTFPWSANSWIRDGNGETLRSNDYHVIQIQTAGAAQLKEVEPGLYEFLNPAREPHTLRRSAIRRLSQWLQVMVSNLAQLPCGYHLDHDRIYATTRHPTFDRYYWSVAPSGDISGTLRDDMTDDRMARASVPTLRLSYTGWGQPPIFAAVETADEDARADASDLNRGNITLAGHPQLHHGPTLISTLSRSMTPADAFRRLKLTHIKPTFSPTQAGLAALLDRLANTCRRNPLVGPGLLCTTVGQLTGTTWGLTSYQRFFWYRLTVGALNFRDRHGVPSNCPHTCCPAETKNSVDHLLWKCKLAETVWSQLLTGWTGDPNYLTANPAEARERIFSRDAPQLRREARQALVSHNASFGHLSRMASKVWTILVSVCAQSLWLARNDATFNNEQRPATVRAQQVWSACHNQLRALSHGSDATCVSDFTKFWATLDGPAVPTSRRPVQACLYFDGGARGNTGPAGCGTVLLRWCEQAEKWEIIWWTAHYAGDKHTNNYAEHTALLHGVQECVRRFTGTAVRLHIIGDSSLVLGQVVGTHACVTGSLRRISRRTGRLLKEFDDLRFSHTLREGNKMADLLANYAMDQGYTSTSTTAWTELDNRLDVYKQNDLEHAKTPLRRSFDLANELTHKLSRFPVAGNPPRKRRRND